MQTVAMIGIIVGVLVLLSGLLPLLRNMYRRYGLYELFNRLVIFKYLNQHGEEAKPHMVLVILGIIIMGAAKALQKWK